MTGDGDRERLVAEIPEELKQLIDVDRRTNREVVEAALWREFGGERKGALERRIEEKKRRINMLESERNERNRELGTKRDELEALEMKLEQVDEKGDELKQKWFDKVRRVPQDTDHPLVQDAAEELGMKPADVIAEAYDR